MIQQCPACRPHAFQDARYGKNVRVHTPVLKGKGTQPMARCTVCRAEKPAANDGKSAA